VSADTYDLTGQAAQVTFSATGRAGSTSSKANLEFYIEEATGTPEAANNYSWALSEGILYASYAVGGAAANIWNAPWSSGCQNLRIRESSGAVYFDTSSDNTNWINRANTSSGVGVTALYADLHYWNFDSSAVAASASMVNFALGAIVPAVQVTATIVDSSNAVVSQLTAAVPFTYDNSEEDIREAVYSAIRAVAGDDTVDISILP
jgi:hypothetical protein